MMLLVVMIPAMAFFSLAYDTEVKLYNNLLQVNFLQGAKTTVSRRVNSI